MKRFLIPSFIAAGLVAPQDNSFAFQGIDNNCDKEAEKEESILNFRLPFVLAGHSSHRSHGSHVSHRSSSGGGGYRAPSVPKYTPLKVIQHHQKVSCRKLNPIPNSIQTWF